MYLQSLLVTVAVKDYVKVTLRRYFWVEVAYCTCCGIACIFQNVLWMLPVVLFQGGKTHYALALQFTLTFERYGKGNGFDCFYLLRYVFAYNAVATCCRPCKIAVFVGYVYCQSVIFQFNGKLHFANGFVDLLHPLLQLAETLHFVQTVQTFQVLVLYKVFERFASDPVCRTVGKNNTRLFFQQNKLVVEGVVLRVGNCRLVQNIVLVCPLIELFDNFLHCHGGFLLLNYCHRRKSHVERFFADVFKHYIGSFTGNAQNHTSAKCFVLHHLPHLEGGNFVF